MTNWKQKFAIIYAGQAFSLIGSTALQFAFIWWLTVQTESALTLTVATLIAMLPGIMVGPFAGIWIDRYNRKTVMIVADLFIGLTSLAAGAAFWLLDSPPLPLIYAVLFLRGIGNTFHAPAMQAAIPLFVPPEMLTKAGGWGNLVFSASTIAGPALGAALYALLPMAGIALIDVLGAMIAVGCLLCVTVPDVPQHHKKLHPLVDMRLGFRALRKNRLLMAALPPVVIVSVLYLPLSALYPLLVRVHYAGEAWHNAVVEVAFSLGMLLASALLGIWGGSKKRFLMVSFSCVAIGISSFLGGALSAGGFWGFVACALAMGGAGTFFGVPITAHIQETVAPQVMGKVLSLWMTIMTLAAPVGLLVAGPLCELLGVAAIFFWAGILIALCGVWCLRRIY
jgi:DHA3 family macrolide efflux protein-like MFS transporter